MQVTVSGFKSILVGGLCLVLLAASVPAQDPPAAPAGVLFFGQEKVGETQQGECFTVPEYALVDALVPAAESARLALAGSSAATACGTPFTYAVAQAFTLTGPATVHFWIECDVASHALPALSTFGFELLRNGEALQEEPYYGDVIMDPCAADVVEVQETGIPTLNAAFQVGDSFTLSIVAFVSATHPDVYDNLFLRAGGGEHIATFAAPGLPAAPAPTTSAPATNETTPTPTTSTTPENTTTQAPTTSNATNSSEPAGGAKDADGPNGLPSAGPLVACVSIGAAALAVRRTRRL